MLTTHQRTLYFNKIDQLTLDPQIARILRRLPMNKQKWMKMILKGGKIISNLGVHNDPKLKKELIQWSIDIIEEQGRQCDMIEQFCISLIHQN